MEKSDHYYQRKSRIKNLIVPTISEAKGELGVDLTDAMFQECPDPLKTYMGLAPLLKGHGIDLWMSPSDILLGKVCLKPPLTSKHIQALTHQGILMIGSDMERKVWNEEQLLKAKALSEQEEMLKFVAELEKRKAVLAAREEERERCEEEKEDLRIKFENRLQDELDLLEEKLKERYDDLMSLQKANLDKEWKDKVREAVEETVARLNKQFLEDLAKQEEELMKKFSIESKKEQIRSKMQVKEAQDCCRETFQNLRHQLQCKNIANLMYVLCLERRRCYLEFKKKEDDYQKQMENLHDLITEKDVEIGSLKKQLDAKIKKCKLREECLIEILKQFQKFINFALRASPTQAQFLLNVEKMLLFELTEAVMSTHKKHAKRLAKKIHSWKTEGKDKSETEVLELKGSVSSLIAKDHHQCYNEIEPSEEVRPLTSSDYLPAFHYNKHMYVREDFRNMMSQGIEISPSNLLWNHDVEHLMQILKTSASSLDRQRREEEEERKERLGKGNESGDEEEEEEVIDEADGKSANKEIPRKSIVCFKANEDDEDTDLLFPIFESLSTTRTDVSEFYSEILPESNQLNEAESPEICISCSIKHSKLESIGSKESPFPLIGTKNSLEIHKESSKISKLSSQQKITLDASSRETMGILGARDSLVKHRMSLRPSMLKMRDSLPKIIELRKNMQSSTRNSRVHISSSANQLMDSETSELKKENISRLDLSRDSFIAHKQSLIFKSHSSSKPSVNVKTEHTDSKKTLKLKKPHKSHDMPERTSLRGPSKHSYNVSIVKSQESLKRNRIPTSKITLSRDSLEIIRSHSKMSALKKNASRDSIEIKTEILSANVQSYPSIIKLEDDGSRTVKMSHIEIVPLEQRMEICNIEQEEADERASKASSMYDTKDISRTDSPWLIYQRNESPEKETKPRIVPKENFLKKPNVARVGGDKKATEHLQTNKEFTVHRAASFITLFKKHPSLMKIFTPCTK